MKEDVKNETTQDQKRPDNKEKKRKEDNKKRLKKNPNRNVLVEVEAIAHEITREQPR
jgi:hypothetical protein